MFQIDMPVQDTSHIATAAAPALDALVALVAALISCWPCRATLQLLPLPLCRPRVCCWRWSLTSAKQHHTNSYIEAAVCSLKGSKPACRA